MSKRKYGARLTKRNMTQEGENMKKSDTAVLSKKDVMKEAGAMKKDVIVKEDVTMKKDTIMTANRQNQFGDLGTFVYLNNKQLRISPEIQRKLNPVRVAEIAANYLEPVCNPVKVNYRDGGYYIFDGMHTRAALMVLNGGDDFPVLCRLFTGMTKEQEAALFTAQFGSSAPVGMIDCLRAMEVAKDPDVLNFLKVTREAGFGITLGSEASPNGSIAAVCSAYKAYGTLGSGEYGRMLTILHRTWAGESWSVNKFMLGGMARFLKMYEVEDASFVKAFREVTQEMVTNEVRRFRGMTKDGAYAAALAEIFGRNSKLKEKRR